jgi:hypothetical protein
MAAEQEWTIFFYNPFDELILEVVVDEVCTNFVCPILVAYL